MLACAVAANGLRAFVPVVVTIGDVPALDAPFTDFIAKRLQPIARITGRKTRAREAFFHAVAEDAVVTDAFDARVATAFVHGLGVGVTNQTLPGAWIAGGLADAALTHILTGAEQIVMDARLAVFFDIVETGPRTVTHVGPIAFRIEWIAAEIFVTQKNHRALAARTAIVRAIIAVRRTRRQIREGRMSAIPGAVA